MEDIKTLHYATKDPIRNLRVRVHLTRLTVQRTLPDKDEKQGSNAQQPVVITQQQAPGTAVPPPPFPAEPSSVQPQAPSQGAPVADNTGPGPASSPSLQQPPQTQPQSGPEPSQTNVPEPARPPAPTQPQRPTGVRDPFIAAERQQQQSKPTRDGSALPMYDPAFAPLAAGRQRQGGGQPIGEANEAPLYNPAAYTAGQPGPIPQHAPLPAQATPPPGPHHYTTQPPQPILVPQPHPLHQGYAALQVPPPHAGPQQPFLSPQASPLPYHVQAYQPGAILSPGASPPPMYGVSPPPMYGVSPPPVYGVSPLPVYAPSGQTPPILPWGLQGPAPPPDWHSQQQGPAIQWHTAHVDPTTGLPVAPPVIIPLPGAGAAGALPHAAAGYPSEQQLQNALALPVLQSTQQGAQSGPPQRLDVTRVFAWQEKVFSVSEVAAARRRAAQRAEAGLAAPAPGLAGHAKRFMSLGSHNTDQGNSKEDTVDPKAQGSVLFSYVHSDGFAEREELTKTVTTSDFEQQQRRYRQLAKDAKMRQEVLNFRTMYILADLGGEDSTPHSHDVVLVCIKAYQDGSFDMRPGFSKPGKKYRFEDESGCVYEYTVEDAGAKAEPSLAKRTAKLQRQVAARAAELRAMAKGNSYFQPPPSGPGSMRLVLLGEIMGCADFNKDHLYVEYLLVFDPSRWEMVNRDWAAAEPGVYRGVTATSKVRQYPANPACNTPERWVAHLAHPLECELCSRGPPPPLHQYPVLMFQVCSLDYRNRYASLGYCWVSLGDCCPGSMEQTLRCWRPVQTLRDLQHEFFIGGSAELQDVQYVERGPLRDAANRHNSLEAGLPKGGVGPKAMNKYGVRTETTGCVKVRLHCLTQQSPEEPEGDENSDAPAVTGAGGGGAAGPMTPPGTPGRRRRDLTLAAVVERARNRLRDARGGDIIVRPGLLSEAPAVRQHPVDVHVSEGQVATFKVLATGLEPLRYQWFKDERKLQVATSDSPHLILAEAAPIDAGTYYCQVSNKDGSANSSKAILKVDKLSRAGRAVGAHATDEDRSVASYHTRASDSRSGTPARTGPSRMSRLQAAAVRRSGGASGAGSAGASSAGGGGGAAAAGAPLSPSDPVGAVQAPAGRGGPGSQMAAATEVQAVAGQKGTQAEQPQPVVRKLDLQADSRVQEPIASGQAPTAAGSASASGAAPGGTSSKAFSSGVGADKPGGAGAGGAGSGGDGGGGSGAASLAGLPSVSGPRKFTPSTRNDEDRDLSPAVTPASSGGGTAVMKVSQDSKGVTATGGTMVEEVETVQDSKGGSGIGSGSGAGKAGSGGGGPRAQGSGEAGTSRTSGSGQAARKDAW